MLRSLEIRNYRNLRHLTIEKLGKVNLLVGKNNTGKTSVLEAIYLLSANGRFDIIHECLEARDSFFESTSENQYLRSEALLSSLFTDRLESGNDGTLKIIAKKETELKELTIKLSRVKINHQSTSPSESIRLAVSSYGDDIERVITGEQFLKLKESGFPNFGFSRDTKPQFVRASIDNNLSIGVLFDKIVTTDRENEVVKTLQTIDSRIAKVAFRTDTYNNKRYPIVGLRDSKNPVPLRSMGDGANRILTIILAMVNCEDGYLFIDEFENGLHYSIQEKIWKIIFNLSEQLNIQVFATTHSNDTIKAFGEVANANGEYSDAQLIQLRNSKGEISAVLFNAQDVEIAMETDYLDLR